MRKQIVLCALGAIAAAAPALAQQPEVEIRQLKKAMVELDAQALAPTRAEAVVEGRITTGRPYSAEATTEFVQALADGNRISRKTTVRIYRDNDGRTRREDLGGGEAVQSISINDPVAHQSFILDPRTRTALKTMMARLAFGQAVPDGVARGRGGNAGAVTVTVTPDASSAEREAAVVEQKRKIETAAAAGMLTPSRGGVNTAVALQRTSAKPTVEQLGQQMIGGVMAEGTRTTTIIPAGDIGNEREIRAVSEQWFSPELQIIVMTKHSDPRTGETTYRLSNIVRGEPGAGLFEIPADYTVKESGTFRILKDPALQ